MGNRDAHADASLALALAPHNIFEERIAIPHGKSAGVNTTSLAIGVSKNPLAWESLDDEPVTVVILFAVTEGDSDVIHLKLLQHVAMLLAHESFVEKLHSVSSTAEMLALLESNPDDYDD